MVGNNFLSFTLIYIEITIHLLKELKVFIQFYIFQILFKFLAHNPSPHVLLDFDTSHNSHPSISDQTNAFESMNGKEESIYVIDRARRSKLASFVWYSGDLAYRTATPSRPRGVTSLYSQGG